MGRRGAYARWGTLGLLMALAGCAQLLGLDDPRDVSDAGVGADAALHDGAESTDGTGNDGVGAEPTKSAVPEGGRDSGDADGDAAPGDEGVAPNDAESGTDVREADVIPDNGPDVPPACTACDLGTSVLGQCCLQ